MNNNDHLFEGVASILRSISGGKVLKLAEETNIAVDLDFDSLRMLELCEVVQRSYGVNITESASFAHDVESVGSLVRCLRKHLQAQAAAEDVHGCDGMVINYNGA